MKRNSTEVRDLRLDFMIGVVCQIANTTGYQDSQNNTKERGEVHGKPMSYVHTFKRCEECLSSDLAADRDLRGGSGEHIMRRKATLQAFVQPSELYIGVHQDTLRS